MTRPNWIFWAEVSMAAAVALGVIVTAAELHGRRRVLKEASAIFVAAALRDAVADLEPSPHALARILARTLRRAA